MMQLKHKRFLMEFFDRAVMIHSDLTFNHWNNTLKM